MFRLVFLDSPKKGTIFIFNKSILDLVTNWVILLANYVRSPMLMDPKPSKQHEESNLIKDLQLQRVEN